MPRRSFFSLAFSLAALAAPLAAQPSIVGTWSVRLPDAVRNQDGVQTVVSTTTATLVLEARGDSVVGTLTRSQSGVPRAVRGTVTGSQATLQADTKARVMTNGEEHTLSLITTFRFTLDGDSMRGTSETRLDPSAKPAIEFPGVEQEPVQVTATRVKK